MILWHTIHCTLFFIWVFPFEVSHIKSLMRQCLYKVICYIIKFSPSGFLEDDIRAYWPYGQGVIRLRLWAYLKKSNNIGDCISWAFSLFFPLVFKEFYLIYRYYFGFFPLGFSKEFPHIFPKRFLWEVVILSIFPYVGFKDNIIYDDILIFDQIVFRLCL
jgi:hypothetical protein